MCVFYRGQGELKIKPKDDQSYIFHAYTDTYCFYVKHHFEENGNQPVVNGVGGIFSFIMVHCMIYTYIECIQLKMCCDKMHLVYQKIYHHFLSLSQAILLFQPLPELPVECKLCFSSSSCFSVNESFERTSSLTTPLSS